MGVAVPSWIRYSGFHIICFGPIAESLALKSVHELSTKGELWPPLPCHGPSPWLHHILLPGFRKRSLGHGHIFIGVCQEFCSQGRGRVCSRGVSALWGVFPHGGGCLLPGGVRGDKYLLPVGCLVETSSRRILLRAVRILLECILV